MVHISARVVATALAIVVALSTAVGFSIARFAIPDPAGAFSASATAVTQVRDVGLTSAVKSLGPKLDALGAKLDAVNFNLNGSAFPASYQPSVKAQLRAICEHSATPGAACPIPGGGY
jgi:hypothetical protein